VATSTLSETQFSIHPATLPGPVSLTVADLENQITFYQRVLGLTLRWREGKAAGIGTPFDDQTANGRELLRMTEISSSRSYDGTTGLYHFAILLPDRRELARAIARLFALKYRNYPTDHIMTKATYLEDPEGNGIELYTESPEDGTWSLADGEYITRRADGTLSDGREPLDLEALFRGLTGDDRLDDPMPIQTRIGHVHLHVAYIDQAIDFYHGLLGFDLMGVARSFQMAFVSAGGYHHHIGLNTWQGQGAPPPPAEALGLRYFSVELPTREALEEVSARIDKASLPATRTEDGLLVFDPSQNGLLLTHQSGT
jgi:catechol 2,3-dioxygenase